MEIINYKEYKGKLQKDNQVWDSVQDYLDDVGLEHEEFVAVAEQQTMHEFDADDLLMRHTEDDDIWGEHISDVSDFWKEDVIGELQALLDAFWQKHKLVNSYMESKTKRVQFDREEIRKAY